ncbi:MAG: hypothetical protein ABJ327_27135 [Litoreibacter sp.]
MPNLFGEWTLYWVHRYNTEGIEGLSNPGGGGVKPFLSEDQRRNSRVGLRLDPIRREMVSCVGSTF